MTIVPGAGALERLTASTATMIRTVDALDDDAFAAPSGLPGWSRGHVVAHLALNAEGLAGVLDGLAHDEPGTTVASVPMYASDEARDRDIDELAGAGAAALRERLLAGCTAFTDAVPRVPTDAWTRVVPRTPGGATFRAAEILLMRHREVEVHHADLAADYGPADWPEAFVVDLLDLVSQDRADDGPFTLHAVDLDRRWSVGDGAGAGPEVAGTGADLGWWLTGRGQGGGLTVEGGALPQLGAWRRRPPAEPGQG